jgi:hypothetical protein
MGARAVRMSYVVMTGGGERRLDRDTSVSGRDPAEDIFNYKEMNNIWSPPAILSISNVSSV